MPSFQTSEVKYLPDYGSYCQGSVCGAWGSGPATSDARRNGASRAAEALVSFAAPRRRPVRGRSVRGPWFADGCTGGLPSGGGPPHRPRSAGSICPLRRRAVERSQPDDQIALTLPAAAAVVVRACGTDIRVGGHQARHPAAGASPVYRWAILILPAVGSIVEDDDLSTTSPERSGGDGASTGTEAASRQHHRAAGPQLAPNPCCRARPACARWPRPAPGQASGLARRHLRPRRVARRRVPALPANTESTCAAASAAGDLHRPASSTPHREAAALLPLDISLGR